MSGAKDKEKGKGNTKRKKKTNVTCFWSKNVLFPTCMLRREKGVLRCAISQ